MGVYDTEDMIESWAINEERRSIIRSVRRVITPWHTGAINVLNGINRDILTSRFSTFSGWQGPIADNQWQLDVQYWFSIWLASLQQSFLNTVLGEVPADPALSNLPRSQAEQTLCKSQKIISPVHVSFSVLGLAIILFTGLFFLVISLSLESCIS
ncbi:hypothetical protein GGR51DRAFT_530503 [Nemania sp. FL0031]|nr:hypothetical protein GGR51DRAFT_530503 [Nemania sp. FL0031]